MDSGQSNLGEGGEAKASLADRVDTDPREIGGNGATGDAPAVPSSYGASGGSNVALNDGPNDGIDDA